MGVVALAVLSMSVYASYSPARPVGSYGVLLRFRRRTVSNCKRPIMGCSRATLKGLTCEVGSAEHRPPATQVSPQTGFPFLGTSGTCLSHAGQQLGPGNPAAR